MRHQENVEQREMELSVVLDLTPELIGVFGPSRERLYANRPSLDYFGLTLEQWQAISDPLWFFHPDDRDRMAKEGMSLEESVGFGWQSALHPNDGPGFEEKRRAALEVGEIFEGEFRLRARTGEYRWYLARAIPLRDERGKVIRWYGTATDIDDRKRAEERLQRENVVLREEIDKASMFEEVVGAAPSLQNVLAALSKVAPTDSTVLVTGETGTGKELIARAIQEIDAVCTRLCRRQLRRHP